MTLRIDEPYTPNALSAFAAAKCSAERLNDEQVGPCHLLLALLEPTHGPIRDLLSSLGGNATALADAAAAAPPNPSEPGANGLLNRDVERVVVAALQEARAMDAPQIDDVHLLLGLLRHEGGPARRVLVGAGLSLDQVRDAVRRAPSRSARWPHPAPSGRWPGAPISGRSHPLRSSLRFGALLVNIRPSPLFIGLLAVVCLSGAMLFLRPAAWAVRPLTVAFILCGWTVSLCLHEFGHALAAFLGGDRSVADKGYLTLDVRRYSNPFLTVVLPVLTVLAGSIPLVGGAVAVETSSLRTRRWDQAVSAGGPFATLLFLLAVAFMFVLGDPASSDRRAFWAALAGLATVEAIALVLTLLPVPPLDGFRIASHWLPPAVRDGAYRLGWAPLLGVYFMLGQDSPVAGLFWTTVNEIESILRLPPGLGAEALGLLRFG